MTRPANNSEACCRPFPGEIYSSGVRANQSTSGFADDAQQAPSGRRDTWLGQTWRTRRDKSDCHGGSSRHGTPTADAPSVKDPQSNQLSSMLAMAEVRALRDWSKRPCWGQALQTCKPATYASTAFTGTSQRTQNSPHYQAAQSLSA